MSQAAIIKVSCFHEEFIAKLVLGLIHHGVKIQAEIPMDVEEVPTILAEGTGEK
jgi:hypothetical protein